MSIRIDKLRLVIYIVLLITGIVFASFYGGPVSFVWLYALLLLIPLSVFYLYINFFFLRIYQEADVHRLTKGDEHSFLVKIENDGFFPIHNMSLFIYEDRCSVAELRTGMKVSLDIHEKKELRSVINCRYVGTYDVGVYRVGFNDPFGIMTVELDNPNSFKAIVSPKITDVADKALDIENMVNNTGLKSAFLFEDTSGSDMREYRRGDPLKSVNWKVTARTNELTVRIPDRMERRTLTILLEAGFFPKDIKDIEIIKKRDKFLEFAVSAAWHFANEGVPVRLVYPSGKVTEMIVDSYESFTDFYNIAADGIFYRSVEEYEKIRSISMEQRSRGDDSDTWIIIREDPQSDEDPITVC